jgi:type III secretion protein C
MRRPAVIGVLSRLGRARRSRSLVAGLALLISVSVGSQRAHAGTPPWSDAPFSYYAEKSTPVTKVLQDFSSSFSLALDLSPQVSGNVNGRFQARSPSEFLDQLGGVYGFQWFTHAGTLFISRTSEVSTTSINASGASMVAVRRALISLGVLDARFGWGELPEQAVALVSGPPAYVALVQSTVANLPLLGGGQKVAVFRLKHASVDDRTITYRDREITTIGLARVLRELVRGDSASIPPGVDGDAVTRLAAPLRASGNLPARVLPPITQQLPGTPPLVDGSPPEGRAADPAQMGYNPNAVAGTRRLVPSIQADSRLNALIVQDTPDRLPMYKALIEQLDVPTALIEIEAMIIDVNTTRLDELGIAWAGRRGGTAAGFGDVSPSTGALTISAARRGANISTTSTVLDVGNYLITRIRALEGIGEAAVHSRPSILTIDHTGALLDLSETFYIRTYGERVATVTPVTVGTTLKVTPHYIEREGFGPTIQLDVDIEDGQIQDRTVEGLPTVRRSTVSTQAIVGENQTLLIGGYNTLQRTHSNDRIPVLGSIPLLGAFFSNKVENRQNRERLFLIKPRMVTIPGPEVVPLATPGGAAPRIVAPAGRELPVQNPTRVPEDVSTRPASPLINPPTSTIALPERLQMQDSASPVQHMPASGEF